VDLCDAIKMSFLKSSFKGIKVSKKPKSDRLARFALLTAVLLRVCLVKGGSEEVKK